MTETDVDAEMESRLRATLQAKAAQLPVDDAPFVPGSGAPGTPGSGRSGGSNRSRGSSRSTRTGRSLWLAVAAAVAVAGTIAGVALVRADRTTTVTQGATEERAGLVRPRAVPDGYELWAISPRSGQGSATSASGPISLQLFGDTQGPRLLVQAGGAERAVGPTDGPPVTVRGTEGTSNERRSGTDPNQAPQVVVSWTEDGVNVTAMAVRATVAETVALVDQLQWNGDGPLSGAAAASAAPLAALGGTQLGSVPSSAVNSYLYDDQPPVVGGTSGFTVTFSRSAPNLTAYYQDWLQGKAPGPDGVIEQSGAVAAPLAETPSSFVTLWWPDGSSAAASSSVLGHDELLEVARSGQPTTEADLDAERAEITARILALPVIATTELSPLTVDVHGEGGTGLCAHAGSGPVACTVAGSDFDTAPGLAVSVDVDGDWYVAGAGLRPFAYTAVSPSYLDVTNGPVTTTEADLIRWRTTDVGPWHLLVAAMPSSVTDGAVDFDTTGTPECPQPSGGSCSLGVFVTRPPT